MLSYLNFILDFIVSPKNSLENMKRKNYLLPAVFIFTVAIFSRTMFEQLLKQGTTTVADIFVKFLFTFIILVILIIMYLGWTHMIASFYSSNIDIKTTLASFFMCFIPVYLLFPFAPVLCVITGQPGAWYMTISIIAFIWIMILLFLSVKSIYSLSPGETIFVFFSPIIFLLACSAILGIGLSFLIYKLLT